MVQQLVTGKTSTLLTRSIILNTASYTSFGEHKSYSVPSGVQDKYTILAGSRYLSPDEVEVFYPG